MYKLKPQNVQGWENHKSVNIISLFRDGEPMRQGREG
jgi:hypothetical protein